MAPPFLLSGRRALPALGLVLGLVLSVPGCSSGPPPAEAAISRELADLYAADQGDRAGDIITDIVVKRT